MTYIHGNTGGHFTVKLPPHTRIQTKTPHNVWRFCKYFIDPQSLWRVLDSRLHGNDRRPLKSCVGRGVLLFIRTRRMNTWDLNWFIVIPPEGSGFPS